MYGHQLELDGDLRAKLQRMVTFVALLYTPAWLACPVAADAPFNDIQLHQDLLQFKAVDGEVAEAVLAVVNRQPPLVPPVADRCSRSLQREADRRGERGESGKAYQPRYDGRLHRGKYQHKQVNAAF